MAKLVFIALILLNISAVAETSLLKESHGFPVNIKVTHSNLSFQLDCSAQSGTTRMLNKAFSEVRDRLGEISCHVASLLSRPCSGSRSDSQCASSLNYTYVVDNSRENFASYLNLLTTAYTAGSQLKVNYVEYGNYGRDVQILEIPKEVATATE